METKPEWLEETDEGSLKITLAKGVTIDGVKVDALIMREPTVADQLAAEASKGTDAAREITMFANLCEVAPGDIRTLTMRDYKRVQRAFTDFTD